MMFEFYTSLLLLILLGMIVLALSVCLLLLILYAILYGYTCIIDLLKKREVSE